MSFATRIASLRGNRGLVTALALVLSASPVLAQTAPAPAKPQAQPAQAPRPAAPAAGAAAPQGNGPMVVQVKPEPSQPEWTKVCGKDQGTNSEICYTTRDFVSDQGQPVLAVALYDIKGAQAKKILRFLMPLGLLLQPGVRFGVDQGATVDGKYAVCFPNGCFAEAEVKDDFIASLKKGANLNVSVQNQASRAVTFAVPVTGFGKAFDGPAIDPKVLEEQQKKLQEELEKKSDELRKKLESSGGAAAPGAAAPAAPKP
ncbi:invasion associated locus B family protein [Microvirga sp. 2MCAF38]|uniref:invasion associated locus B family protein n=1 Tax=Microvirga sp. 2MCAF38 TaxID=3232989 RepID=UPI003F958F05